ncbi:MAG: serine/threonine-protein kinase [Chthoniobacterales bacterium]
MSDTSRDHMSEENPDALEQSCPACASTVDVTDAEPLARVTCPGCGEKFRVDRVFDHFVLTETLGVGGMGSVYKAHDTRLERFVALKVLRKELSADAAEAARLEQEARVTASVNHPNVVQVYSTGRARGQVYLVMELVNHGSLDDLMAEQPRVAEAQVLATGIQVARGLQAAQERGLVHRDVKPANILFADAETAKIGDFGLAVAAGQDAEARHEIWGTPYYVAPERLNNEPEDFRSDIFSLGATLFHALAGEPPIDGESTSAAALLEQKRNPPTLAAVASDVSPETARLVDRMISPEPAKRFASYSELLDEMERAHRPFSGEPDPKRLRRWWFVLLIAAFVVAGAAGFYVTRERHAAQASIATASKDFERIAVLQRRYGEARQQLISGNYDAARADFAQLSKDADGLQPLLNWIVLHRGLAALLQNDASAARAAFEEVERAANFSNAPGDAELARFFRETAHRLASGADATADANATGLDAFGGFLAAVKNWRTGQFEAANALLASYVQAVSSGPLAWIDDYKPLARKFMNDYALFSEWKKQPHEFKTATEIGMALKQLRANEKKLQTRGPLADAMKADEKRLAADQRRIKKTEAAQNAASSRIAAEEKPAWDTALLQERKAIAAYDFAGALAAIGDLDVSDPSLIEAQDAERKKLQWLAAWKAKLVADLSTGRFAGAVTDLRGVSYTGVTRANENGITLRIPPYGSAEVKWTDLAPKALLDISRSFIAANPAESADRQWLAAVFASATGQPTDARALAEAAAKLKPEYAAQLKLIAR